MDWSKLNDCISSYFYQLSSFEETLANSWGVEEKGSTDDINQWQPCGGSSGQETRYVSDQIFASVAVGTRTISPLFEIRIVILF